MEGLKILSPKKKEKKEKKVESNPSLDYSDYSEWKISKEWKNKDTSFPSIRDKSIDKSSSLYHDASSKDKLQHKTPEVFDNFIDDDTFPEIKYEIVYSDLEMEFCSYVTARCDDDEQILTKEYHSKWSWCLTHKIFNVCQSSSPVFPLLNNSLFQKLESLPKNNIKCLHKCNIIAYPNTETIKENLMYHDYHWSVNTGILFLNTCDGYVKFQDGTKVNAVENRFVLFDGSKPHCLSSTTNEKLMYTININFL